MHSKVLLIFSGGLDSTVLLYHLKQSFKEISCLSINYGQRHLREISAAKVISELLGVKHQTTDISDVASLLSGSALTTPTMPIPHGHYTDDTMRATVVPNRNMIMLSVALGYAISLDYEVVAYGAHRGDHAIYPDCRPEFAEAMNVAAGLCDYKKRSVISPFIELTKSEIVSLGAKLHVPFELTWSCYEGGEKHCGECGTCVERREAFTLARVEDPTSYRV